MDEEEIDRLLFDLGIEMPNVAGEPSGDGLPPKLDDPEELGDYE